MLCSCLSLSRLAALRVIRSIALKKDLCLLCDFLHHYPNCPKDIVEEMLFEFVLICFPEAIKILTEEALLIHAPNACNYEIALELAIQSQNYDVFHLLLEKGNNLVSNKGELLSVAARLGDIECVKLLINFGADIHFKDNNALRQGAASGETQVVKYLLSHGACVSDNTLVLAAMNQHHDIIKLLLPYIPPDFSNTSDKSLALFNCAVKGETATIVEMMKYGIDQTLLNENQFVSLGKKGHRDVLQLLSKMDIALELEVCCNELIFDLLLANCTCAIVSASVVIAPSYSLGALFFMSLPVLLFLIFCTVYLSECQDEDE
mmetsp:Transcript_24/g.25  ORF Transcript_24/g.25 Transcript_24/m.25 type:complete len:319 (+) Transcript_24:51-1007(+)